MTDTNTNVQDDNKTAVTPITATGATSNEEAKTVAQEASASEAKVEETKAV